MTRARLRAIHAGVVALGLLPLAALAFAAATDGLGANPIEAITHETGAWGLRLLLATLAVTPLRRWMGWAWLAPYRRTLGLLCFTYACTHFATWALFDLGLDLGAIAEDIAKRPFVTAGLATLVCLTPLAITSTRGWMRRLGRRWTRLHRLVYLAALLAVLHFWWGLKLKTVALEPFVYGAVLALLLLARLRARAATLPSRTAPGG